ncbi:hypothetical protein LRS74_23480 [Streptomyces sp. LX-29]|uniref:protealysin inhibitor emfourin n=1 Tax=unclassified Streptomyces TaxID=2593676 RepID=UPI001185E4C6|nr:MULTISPECIES: protealysin inhibitor emfourin [unclassified Streptomyces]TVL91914.1 hypothetical protein CD790_14625 [Streptomyces sp. SAJ15]WFB09677.1 hypothetical protein LRS74_23480 [Streptomyces sp. LX-29]
MRISVIRSGGFAGIERRAELDTSGRPDARHLEALAHQAVSASPAEATAVRGVPDGFSYEITVDGRTAHCADPHLSDAQRELVRAVLREGA